MADADANPGPPLTASEVGRYVFCARAWWLQRVQGYAPENLAALRRGVQRHEAHGRVMRGAERRLALARWLAGLAILLGLVLIALWVYR